MFSTYRIDAPYPRPDRLDRNIRYARALLDLYSGQASKLTCVAQYFYHHQMAERHSQAASDCLRGIAFIELHHLDLLGEYINHLGLYPTYSFYQGTRRVRWNAGFVYYGRNLRDMVDADIAIERRSVERCECELRRIPEAQIQALIRRISQDDELHVKILTELRETL